MRALGQRERGRGFPERRRFAAPEREKALRRRLDVLSPSAPVDYRHERPRILRRLSVALSRRREPAPRRCSRSHGSPFSTSGPPSPSTCCRSRAPVAVGRGGDPLFRALRLGLVRQHRPQRVRSASAPGGGVGARVLPALPDARAGRSHLLTGLDPLWALTAVSWIAFVFALPLFGEECRARLGPERARGPLPFLLLYPVAFFFAAAYTESLFFLLLLLAFRLIRTERPLAAILVGLLLGLTRAPAAAVGPALALAYVLRPDGRKRLPTWPPPSPSRRSRASSRTSSGSDGGRASPGSSSARWAPGRTVRRAPSAGPSSFLREQVELFSSGTLFRHPGAIAPLAHFTLFAVLAVVQVAEAPLLRRGVDGGSPRPGVPHGHDERRAALHRDDLPRTHPALRAARAPARPPRGGAHALGGAAPPPRRALRELALRLVRGRVCFGP